MCTPNCRLPSHLCCTICDVLGMLSRRNRSAARGTVRWEDGADRFACRPTLLCRTFPNVRSTENLVTPIFVTGRELVRLYRAKHHYCTCMHYMHALPCRAARIRNGETHATSYPKPDSARASSGDFSCMRSAAACTIIDWVANQE